MSKEKLRQNRWLGAFTAGVLGTLTTLFSTNAAKKKEPRPERKGDIFNKKMILGGIAGGMVGAAAALLLAPKSGSELLKGLSNPLSRYLKKAAAPLKKSTPKRKKAIQSPLKVRSVSGQHNENQGVSKKTAASSKQKKGSRTPKTSTKAISAST